MKKTTLQSFAVLAFLVQAAGPAGAANAPYMPYESIPKYYTTTPEQPAVNQAPAPARPEQPPALKQPGQKQPGQKQPPVISEAPEFLFPAKLGFGVAVGVPYDMIYLDKQYYVWQGGTWYRSPSYRGPWTEIGYSQLPPQLRKQQLAKIRQERNKEFRLFFKDKKGYQGNHFRPGAQLKEEK